MNVVNEYLFYKPMLIPKGEKYEFGLGLDYWMEMTASTVLPLMNGMGIGLLTQTIL